MLREAQSFLEVPKERNSIAQGNALGFLFINEFIARPRIGVPDRCGSIDCGDRWPRVTILRRWPGVEFLT